MPIKQIRNFHYWVDARETIMSGNFRWHPAKDKYNSAEETVLVSGPQLVDEYLKQNPELRPFKAAFLNHATTACYAMRPNWKQAE